MTTSERENLVIEFLRTPTYRKSAFKILRCLDDVDDAMQATAIIALRKLRLDHPEPWAWLRVVLHNECKRIIRCERPPYAEPPAGWEPSEEVDQSEIAAARDAIRSMKPRHRTALSQSAMGYSYQEIAERQGWTIRQVDRYMVKGTQALRNLITLEA